jgi:hypothetical protein
MWFGTRRSTYGGAAGRNVSVGDAELQTRSFQSIAEKADVERTADSPSPGNSKTTMPLHRYHVNHGRAKRAVSHVGEFRRSTNVPLRQHTAVVLC